MLGLCRGQPYWLLNGWTVTFVHYILHHGAEWCRFLNTEGPFKTFSYVWCKNKSIPKFLHVINIYFYPLMCFFSSIWCGHKVPRIGKYHLSTYWCACKYQACFATCTHVRCRLSTISILHTCICCVWRAVLVQHYLFCYFILIMKESEGIISVTCSAIAVQLKVYCSDWPTGQKITTAYPSPHVTRPWSSCKKVVIFWKSFVFTKDFT